ncbi:MAG: electron transfer flavoprotein subunit beta/FixA family protein [Desulfobacterales bacterium]|nr:electron transfer flavoprotein subunit beta/FixA family protein [Desulfobacterales bacterium]
MHIVVCTKQIVDPEIPSGEFKVDFEAKRAVPDQGEPVLNPYDENAIEVALQLKDRDKDIKVTVLTMGGESSQKVLRRALAMGCDEAIWLKDPSFEALDSAGTAAVIAKAIRQAGNVDIVLCGRQAGDWDMGQVGALLAEELQTACIPMAYNIEKKENALFVKRETENGMAVLEAGLPLVANITNSSTNQPRYPSVKGVLMAGRKKIPTFSAGDLSIDAEIPKRVVVEELTLPSYDRQVLFIDGEDGPEKAVNLAAHLIKMNLIK